jgi:branched-chain amino acid transport system substrate-binding protein
MRSELLLANSFVKTIRYPDFFRRTTFSDTLGKLPAIPEDYSEFPKTYQTWCLASLKVLRIQRRRKMERKGCALSYLLVILILVCAMSQVAAAEEPITICATLPVTGPPSIAATTASLDSGLKDCIAMTNEEGGINGKKIRYFYADDQYKPDVGTKVFEDLMAKYNPLCVFGSGTPVAAAVAPLIRDRYKVLFTSTSFSAKIAFGGVPSMFVVGPTYGDQFAVALKYIAQLKKGAKVAFFYSQGPFGEDPLPYGRVICERLKLNLVAEVGGDMKSTDHTAQIEQLKSKNPDYVIMQGWVGPKNAALIKQCNDLELKSQMVVTLWGAMESVIEALGPDGPKFLAVSPYAYWSMTDVPMIKKIRDYTTKHYPDVKQRSLDYIVTFTSCKIFVECLKRADAAGQLDGEGVTKALQSLKDLETGGLTPPLTIRGNRFPVARILQSNPTKGIFEPVSDWIQFY